MKTARVSKSIMDKLGPVEDGRLTALEITTEGRYILATRKVFGEDKEEIVGVVIRYD